MDPTAKENLSVADTSSYQEAARLYADAVQDLFAPAHPSPAGRAAHDLPSAADMVERAERLAPLSANLTRATAERLADENSGVRAEAAARLLAKALSDVEISRYLLLAARRAEGGSASTRGPITAPGQAIPPDIQDSLSLLVCSLEETTLPTPTRAVIAVTDLPSARTQLTRMIDESLNLIQLQAAKTGQAAIGGLMALGMAQVVQAAGIVGMQVAEALGQTEKATRLYMSMRDFAVSAYESLLALLGPTLAQMAANQVVTWLSEIVEGEQFAKLVARLYETAQTNEYLNQVVIGSQANLEQFVVAIQGVDELKERYEHQTGLVNKVLQGFGLLNVAAVAILPQARLFMAAVYIVAAAYVVLAGADFVDAQRVKLLDRVPGVRQTVENSLIMA
jgi:hypothetical protein